MGTGRWYGPLPQGVGLLAVVVAAAVLEVGLGRRQARDGDAVGGARNVVRADLSSRLVPYLVGSTATDAQSAAIPIQSEGPSFLAHVQSASPSSRAHAARSGGYG